MLTAPPPVPQVSTRSSGRSAGRCDHRAAQRIGRAGHFVRRLPLHAQPDEQRGDLRRRRLAAHDDAERRPRLAARLSDPPMASRRIACWSGVDLASRH